MCDEHARRLERGHRPAGPGAGALRQQDAGAHRGVRAGGAHARVQRTAGPRRHHPGRLDEPLRAVLPDRRHAGPRHGLRSRPQHPRLRRDHHDPADLRDAVPRRGPRPDLPRLSAASPLPQAHHILRPRARCPGDPGVRLRDRELRDGHLPSEHAEPDGLRLRHCRAAAGDGGRASHHRLAPADPRRRRDRVCVLRRLHAGRVPRSAEGPRCDRRQPVLRPRRHARNAAPGGRDVHHHVHDLRRGPRSHRGRQVLRRPRVRPRRTPSHRRRAHRDLRVLPVGHRFRIWCRDHGHARRDRLSDAEEGRPRSRLSWGDPVGRGDRRGDLAAGARGRGVPHGRVPPHQLPRGAADGDDADDPLLPRHPADDRDRRAASGRVGDPPRRAGVLGAHAALLVSVLEPLRDRLLPRARVLHRSRGVLVDPTGDGGLVHPPRDRAHAGQDRRRARRRHEAGALGGGDDRRGGDRRRDPSANGPWT